MSWKVSWLFFSHLWGSTMLADASSRIHTWGVTCGWGSTRARAYTREVSPSMLASNLWHSGKAIIAILKRTRTALVRFYRPPPSVDIQTQTKCARSLLQAHSAWNLLIGVVALPDRFTPPIPKVLKRRWLSRSSQSPTNFVGKHKVSDFWPRPPVRNIHDFWNNRVNQYLTFFIVHFCTSFLAIVGCVLINYRVCLAFRCVSCPP